MIGGTKKKILQIRKDIIFTKNVIFFRREPCQSAKIGTAHFTFYSNGKAKNPPVPPIFRRNLENVTFENKFSEKHRPTILQSYKLLFFSNL